MKTRNMLVTMALGSSLLLSACASGGLSGRESGALLGGAGGAGLGAIIGHQSGHKAKGAVIGGAAGALGGWILGDQVDAARQSSSNDRYDDRSRDRDDRYDRY